VTTACSPFGKFADSGGLKTPLIENLFAFIKETERTWAIVIPCPAGELQQKYGTKRSAEGMQFEPWVFTKKVINSVSADA
jgi:hypothetical protein